MRAIVTSLAKDRVNIELALPVITRIVIEARHIGKV